MKRQRVLSAYSPEIESEQESWILSILRQEGALSRAELASRTGLSRSALEARLKWLEDRCLIEEVGPGTSSGGRRPMLLRFAKDSGYVVAVDLGATSVDVAVTNLNAEIMIHLYEETDVCRGPEPVLAQIRGLIENGIAQAGIDRSQVKGIGMGIPGPVEFRSGTPVSPPIMPGWDRFPLRQYFEDGFGWPVFVDNDVNIMALGERWAGLGQRVDNFFFVKIGTGIGCGIICRGQIYRGADGCAGDIGHIAVVNSDVVCRCGNAGCLEAVAGGAALGRVLEQAVKSGRYPLVSDLPARKDCFTAADLGTLLERGDPFAVDLVRRAGSTIGLALAGLVNFYNPSLVVIGGGVSKLGYLLLASVREGIYHRSLPLATRNLIIQKSALGDDAGVTGAAAMVLGELFRLTPVASS